jgi:hypothetical protein
MTTVRATLDTAPFFRHLDAAVNDAIKVMEVAAAQTMEEFRAATKKKRLSSSTKGSLGVRSGQLRRSLLSRVKVKGKKVIAKVEFSSRARGVSYSQAKLRKIVEVHELGTKGKGGKLPAITPKRSDWLTVPLKAALNRSGTPKKRKARDWPNTFVFKAKNGKLFIVQRRGKQLVFLYVRRR